MFGEEKQDEDLKALEAKLAALRPRADGLDPRWRFLLAQEAALNQNLPADAVAAGSCICSRCGDVLSGRRDRRRWAWPAAFSAMTAVTAVLLVVLVLRVEPKTTAAGVGNGVVVAAAPSPKRQPDSDSLPVVNSRPRRGVSFGSDEAAYLSLRDRVLCFGVESWRQPASTVAAAENHTERILSPRERLDRLSDQEFPFGS